MADTFAKQVAKWAKKARQREREIAKDAPKTLARQIKTTVNEGGNMPKITGYLRTSMVASTVGMPMIEAVNKRDIKVQYAGGSSVINYTIDNAGIEDTLYFGITAKYAYRQEYGFKGTDSLGRKYNQSGKGFVRLGVQNWQSIIKASIAKAKVKYR